VKIEILGQGNINDTYVVHTEEHSFVLQKINDQVFPDPLILIDNLQHLSLHLSTLAPTTKQRWEDAILLPALDGALFVYDDKGAVWRALTYIDSSTCLTRAETVEQATQTGWALGHFHKRLAGLDPRKMQVPLPGFHILKNYLKHYAQICKDHKKNTSKESQFCKQVIEENREGALLLENTLSRKQNTTRIIHGDPKISNILFDRESGRAVTIIDLDTVGPGLLQHDIGDCLRSVCNTYGEEAVPDTVTFDLTFCKGVLEGYFNGAEGLLTPEDCDLIYDGIQAITYELGLRFFMDYLQGGIYFKCNTVEETLQKALVQFTLLQDIIVKKKTIHKLIQQISL